MEGFLETLAKEIEWGKRFLEKPKIEILSQSVRKIKSTYPLVSSIVPCYNRKQILKSTIESLTLELAITRLYL